MHGCGEARPNGRFGWKADITRHRTESLAGPLNAGHSTLMRLLLIVAVVIAALWPAYWLLTRKRPPVRRNWSWQRLYIRTVDKLLTDSGLQGVLAFVILSPLLLYWAGSGLLGFHPTFLGWAIAACGSVLIVVLAIRRAATWIARASRPADETRARWQDRILSREYRTGQPSKRRS